MGKCGRQSFSATNRLENQAFAVARPTGKCSRGAGNRSVALRLLDVFGIFSTSVRFTLNGTQQNRGSRLTIG